MQEIRRIPQTVTLMLAGAFVAILLLFVAGATVSAQSEPPESARIDKQVRLKSQSTFSNRVQASPGQVVVYKVTVTNTTSDDFLADVRDVIGEGVDFIENTLDIDGSIFSDNTSFFTTKGISIGTLKPGQTKTLQYHATIPATANTCGREGLKNQAYVRVSGEEIANDTAIVDVCTAGLPQVGPGQTALLLFLATFGIAGTAHYAFAKKRSY